MADEGNVGDVKIGIKTEFDDKGIKEAGQSLGILGKLAGSAQDGLGKLGMAGQVAAGILGADFVKSAAQAIVKVVQFGVETARAAGQAEEALHHLSEQTGITVQQFDRMLPILNRTGISSQELGMGFRTLSQRMQQAQNPASQASETFRRLGITITGLETPSEVFQLIQERISSLPPGFERTATMVDLMGRAGMRLIPVMSESKSAMNGFAEASAHAALILNTDARNALLKVDDSFDDLKTAGDDLSKHLGVLFAPFVQSLNEARVATTNWLTELVDQTTVGTRMLGSLLSGTSKFFKEAFMAKDVDGIVQAFKKWNAEYAENVKNIKDAGVNTKDAADTQDKTNAAAIRARAGIVALGEAQETLGHSILATNIAMRQQEAERFGTEMQKVAQDISARFGENVTADQAAIEVQAGNDIFRESLNERANLISRWGEDVVLAVEQIRQLTGEEENYENAAKQMTLGLQMRTEQTKAWSNSLTTAQQAARQAAAQSAILAAMPAGPFGHTDVQRQAAIRAINEEVNARKVAAQHMIVDQQQLETELTTLEMEGTARRIQVAQQFPTFYQQQLQDLVKGNQFSLAQISQNFTNATAQWIVTGQNFAAFWQQLQVTLVQAVLNSLIQMGANLLLQNSLVNTQLLAEHTALEAAKTGISAAGDATRTIATIFASKAAAAAAVAGIGAAGLAMIAVMSGVVIAIAGVFAAIGAGLLATVVGAPFAPEFEVAAGATIVAGTTALVGASSAITAAVTTAGGAAFGPGFAKGGIAFGPSIFGEAGPEAAIPLNDRGADFMNRMLGTGGGRSQVISLNIDGIVWRRWLLEGMPDEVRLRAGAIA